MNDNSVALGMKASTQHTSSSSSNSLNMLSMSMKEFWIILWEQETDGVITDARAQPCGEDGAINSSHL